MKTITTKKKALLISFVCLMAGLLLIGEALSRFGAPVQAQGETPLRLNEVEIDPPGVDACQYVELRGTPSSVVPAGTFFLSVNGDAGGFGAISRAVNLSGVTVGTNGAILIILDPVNIAECAGRIYGA